MHYYPGISTLLIAAAAILAVVLYPVDRLIRYLDKKGLTKWKEYFSDLKE